MPTQSELFDALKKLKQDIRSCNVCSLHQRGSYPVPGTGSPHARLLIVGIAPTVGAENKRMPFVNSPGCKLDCWLEYVGLARNQVYITNAIKCVPRSKAGVPIFPADLIDDSWGHACLQWFGKELQIINPEVILLLGAQPVQWIRSFGSVLEFQNNAQGKSHKGRYWFALHHPSSSTRLGEWIRNKRTQQTADEVRRLVVPWAE